MGRSPAATKASCPQISPIGADFQRKGKREMGETTASVRPPSLLLSPAPLPLESAKICVICGFSNSFTSGDLQHIPSESLSRKQEVAPWRYREERRSEGENGRLSNFHFFASSYPLFSVPSVATTAV